MQIAEERPELLDPITEAPVYLKVEAWLAGRQRTALHLEDILARRMSISIDIRARWRYQVCARVRIAPK